MQEFKTGQRVKVEYEGVVESTTESQKGLYVVSNTKGAPGACHWVRLDSPDLKVTLLDPADWPPRQGDIWVTKDGYKPVREWFCQSSRMYGFVMRSEDTGTARLALEEFKALNPVLVRRRGQ